jgi:hypothetical protein
VSIVDLSDTNLEALRFELPRARSGDTVSVPSFASEWFQGRVRTALLALGAEQTHVVKREPGQRRLLRPA